jgi:hypothetical protein
VISRFWEKKLQKKKGKIYNGAIKISQNLGIFPNKFFKSKKILKFSMFVYMVEEVAKKM